MMEEKRSNRPNNERRHTQWEGLFVSQHAWDSDNGSDPQPMLSAEEKQAIWDMLLVAYERKCPVFIQSWKDRHFHYKRCTIRELDWEQRLITYEEPFGGQQLAIGTITSIYMLD
jgi:YolD-like protein